MQPHPIVWNEKFLTGITAIDEQHKILVSMLNEANQRLNADSNCYLLAELISDLMSYALYHFDTEEELMVNNRYDSERQALHFQEHRSFSAKMAGLQRDMNQGQPVSPEALLQFLNNWLRNHILHTDKQLGRFLIAANPSNT